MKALGIDLKKDTIQLAWRGLERWHLRNVNVNRHEAMDAVFAEAREFGCRIAIIEKPYVGYRSVVDEKTGQKTTVPIRASNAVDLGISHGMAKAYARMHGMKPISKLASEWQPAMLTINGHTPRKRDDLKEASKYVAEKIGATIRNDDEADAVCMAEYGRLHARTLLEGGK